MWARLRRFSKLPRSAQVDFVRAALLLPLIRMSLRLRGFRPTQISLQSHVRRAGAPPTLTAAEEATQQASRMLLAAARRCPLTISCLERSLALWWLLARRGIVSQLRIGARKDGSKFEAHAWVERNGAAVGDPEGTHLHYAAFEKEFSGELP